MRHSVIQICTEEPDCSNVPRTECEWEFSACAGAHKEIPEDAPEPLGKPVVTATHVDANPRLCVLTGKSVTGALHLFNKTSADWRAKKQCSPSTANACGSECIAAGTATEQVIDNRISLRHLGVPVKESSMFGNNESVVNISSNIPTDKLCKRHIALSWHAVCKAIAAKVLHFIHVLVPSTLLTR